MKKTLALIGIAVFVAAAGAQRGLTTFTDKARDFQLTFREFSFENRPGGVYHFELTNPGGQVHAVSKSQGIEFFATKMQVDAISVLSKEANAIRNATATGGVRTIREVAGSKAEMTGSKATYSSKGPNATLNLAGPVKMTNSGPSGQIFVATGSSLVADLGNSKTFKPFRTATLNGPVHMNIRQAATNGQQATNVSISARKLVVDEASKPATITISGDIRITGLASGTTIESALSRIVLTLNDRGEVIRTVGSGGNP